MRDDAVQARWRCVNQIPDSDPACVLSAAAEFYRICNILWPYPRDLKSLATSIAALARTGHVVALDPCPSFPPQCPVRVRVAPPVRGGSPVC